ncbi:hypothetical protein PHMEG_0004043 [Phytophthora megakarya]|uniref:WRKY19-like zinc finger domain-containing protein n=1 Tax=Phytophthora megakarya TaxID=4795 RepID=A0A225WUR1_9STRA|nr:hypothetical protein PHMEG_0004043 [Phytophthora megakarya]
MASTVFRRCSVSGCNKQAQTRRLCKAHGGGVRCRVVGCEKLVQTRGLCVAHGGGCRCLQEGCSKLGQYTGFCLTHGGGRRCSVPNCQKFVQLRGYCKRHGRIFLSESSKTNIQAINQQSIMSKFSLNFLLNPIDDDKETSVEYVHVPTKPGSGFPVNECSQQSIQLLKIKMRT